MQLRCDVLVCWWCCRRCCWMLASCLRACVLFTLTHFGLFSPLFEHTFTPSKPLSHPSRHPETCVRFQKPLSSHFQPLNPTFEPLRSTQSHHEPLKNSEKPQKPRSFFSSSTFAGDRGPFVPCSWRLCSRIVLGCASALVSCCIFERVHRTEKATTPIAAQDNHGPTHRGRATILVIPPTHVVQTAWWCLLRFQSHFHQQELLQLM